MSDQVQVTAVPEHEVTTEGAKGQVAVVGVGVVVWVCTTAGVAEGYINVPGFVLSPGTIVVPGYAYPPLPTYVVLPLVMLVLSGTSGGIELDEDGPVFE